MARRVVSPSYCLMCLRSDFARTFQFEVAQRINAPASYLAVLGELHAAKPW